MLVERGHMPPPEPEAPGVFSMGTEERMRVLLEGAGFADVRIEEIPVRFAFSDVDDYVSFAAEKAGPFAMVIRGLSESERQTIEARLAEAFAPFAADGGYELPGVALAAAGRRGSSSSRPCSNTSRRSTTVGAATPRSACLPG